MSAAPAAQLAEAAPVRRINRCGFLTIVRRRPALAASSLVLLIVLVAAFVSPALTAGAYRQDVLHRNAPPSAAHWLGTDELGRDMAARLAVGARVSMIVAVTSSLMAVAIGVMVGMVAGYLGGLTDSAVMRLVDSMYA